MRATCGRGSLRYVLWFVDEVMFSHQKAHKRVIRTLDDVVFGRVRQMAVPGAKSAVSDCVCLSTASNAD